jgi:hypothetical protein
MPIDPRPQLMLMVLTLGALFLATFTIATYVFTRVMV